MGFLFECGDKIVQVKASAAPGFQHVLSAALKLSDRNDLASRRK